jgi:hypothetical protein
MDEGYNIQAGQYYHKTDLQEPIADILLFGILIRCGG